MPPIPFDAMLGPSYTLISPKAELQRAVNCGRIRIETEAGPGKFLMVKSPGQTPIFQPSGGTGQFRGNGIELNGQLTYCIDNKLYVNDQKNHVLTPYSQAVMNDQAPVRFAASQTSVMFVSGGQLWRADGSNLSQKTISGVTFIDVVFMGSYYVALSNATTFYFSTDDGVTWNAANAQIAQADANNFVGAIVHQDILFIYGNRVTLPYAVGSNLNAPFVSQTSGTIPYGAETVGSIQAIGDYRYWLGRTKRGQYVVYRGRGYQTQRISNFGVENQIRTYAKKFGIGDAFAQVYTLNGQDYYRIHFPKANASWELNSTLTEATGVPEWVEVAAQPLGQIGFNRHRANMLVSAFGTLLTGDFQNGWLSEFTPDEYTDQGYPLPWLRKAPHLSTNGLRIHFDQVRLVIETGVGVDPPLWLQSYSMNRATFVSTLATEVAAARLTQAQANTLQNIYDLVPYTPLNPWPSPDEMYTTLGFVPWGGFATLSGGTVIGGPPQIGLSYSNNAGKTFSPTLYRSLGMEGDELPVHWDRLGASADRVFTLQGDFPAKLSIAQCWLDAEVLLS